MIDLTGDDDDDSEGDDGDHTEVSWLRTIRTARHRVRLIPPSLIDRIQVADQLPFPLTALSAKVTGTHTPTTSQRRLQRPHLVGRDTLEIVCRIVLPVLRKLSRLRSIIF